MARLDGWALINLGPQRYAGIVSGHPKLPDGQQIFTSEVEKILPGENGEAMRIETRNTIYILGEFDQELSDQLIAVGLSAQQSGN